MTPKASHGGARKGAGRKPGEPHTTIKLPVRVVEAARVERAPRLPDRFSVPQILAEWCDRGRDDRTKP